MLVSCIVRYILPLNEWKIFKMHPTSVRTVISYFSNNTHKQNSIPKKEKHKTSNRQTHTHKHQKSIIKIMIRIGSISNTYFSVIMIILIQTMMTVICVWVCWMVHAEITQWNCCVLWLYLLYFSLAQVLYCMKLNAVSAIWVDFFFTQRNCSCVMHIFHSTFIGTMCSTFKHLDAVLSGFSISNHVWTVNI